MAARHQPVDKLQLIEVYQPMFPKNNLADANFKPIMIGKSSLTSLSEFMTEKIEEIYNFSVDRIIRRQDYGSCAECIADYLWHKYQRNSVSVGMTQVYYHQAIINLLYSVNRLGQSNDDIAMFDSLIVGRYTFDQFVAFLTYREIFQSITKMTIFGNRR